MGLSIGAYARAAAWIAGADRWTDNMWRPRTTDCRTDRCERISNGPQTNVYRYRWRATTSVGTAQATRVLVELYELMRGGHYLEYATHTFGHHPAACETLERDTRSEPVAALRLKKQVYPGRIILSSAPKTCSPRNGSKALSSQLMPLLRNLTFFHVKLEPLSPR